MFFSYKSVYILLLSTCFDLSFSQQDFNSCTSVESLSDPMILDSLNGRLQGQCFDVPVTYSQDSTENSDVFVWKGVPFAEPPINEKRYMRPEPVKSWNNIRNAVEFSNSCMQSGSFANAPQSEDCLYLNIFVKSDSYRNRKSTLKPIMVWIHGGGLTEGSASEPTYEFSTLVAMSDVVGISINYRLGHFGFSYFPGTEATGNQGFLDQNLALKWVYDNADRFGGDRTKITIFGESAGAWSVNFHLFYPGSWPYFRNAIMQSGGVKGPENIIKLLSKNEASQRTNFALRVLNCDGLSPSESLLCAQNVDSSRLLNRTSIIPTSLNIDGFTFSKNIDELALENSFKKANIITGFNSDENGLFISNPQELFLLDFDQFRTDLESLLNIFLKNNSRIDVTSILNEYQRDNPDFTNYGRSLIQITSDPLFVCPAFDLAVDYSIQKINAYMYEFKYKSPVTLVDLDPLIGVAVHADELPFVFAVPLSNKLSNQLTKSPFSDVDREFSRKLVTYWTNFAKNDNPNIFDASNNLPIWNTLNPIDFSRSTAREKMKLGRFLLMENSDIKMTSDISSHRCDFWNITRDSSLISTTTGSNLFNLASKNQNINNHLFIFILICLNMLLFI